MVLINVNDSVWKTIPSKLAIPWEGWAQHSRKYHPLKDKCVWLRISECLLWVLWSPHISHFWVIFFFLSLYSDRFSAHLLKLRRRFGSTKHTSESRWLSPAWGQEGNTYFMWFLGTANYQSRKILQPCNWSIARVQSSVMPLNRFLQVTSDFWTLTSSQKWHTEGEKLCGFSCEEIWFESSSLM